MASTAPLTLSTIAPDFESLVSQLQAALSSQNLAPAWSDLLATSTGTHLIDFIAAVGAMDQYAIERAVQELYLPTAELNSSIYAIITSLGVRIARMTPAQATFSLTWTNLTQTEVIPAYSQFIAGGLFWYNTEPIIWNNLAEPTQTVTLWQGEIVSYNFLGSGESFQVFSSSETGFTVADSGVQVSIDGESIPIVTNGLWNYPNNQGVQDFTSASGNLTLLFGNALFGSRPTINSQIQITYPVTLGAAANSASFSGTTINSAEFPAITGAAITAISGGAAQPSASLYATIGPNLYAANSRAVTPQDYNSLAATYPGVIDARIEGPRSYAPNDVTYMNLLRASLLTTTEWTEDDYTTFYSWFTDNYAMANVAFWTQEPVTAPLDLVINVYAASAVIDPGQLQQSVMAAVTSLMTPQQSIPILGMSLFLSTVSEVVDNVSGVDYSQIMSPRNDFYANLISPTNYFNTLTFSPSGGNLAAGSYNYGFTAVTSQGEGLLIPFNTFTASASGGEVTLAVNDQYLTEQFNFYRAPVTIGTSNDTIGTYQFIGSVASLGAQSVRGTQLQFVDNGITPTAQTPPLVDQSGVWYVSIGSLTVNVYPRSSKATYINSAGVLT